MTSPSRTGYTPRGIDGVGGDGWGDEVGRCAPYRRGGGE